MQFEVICELFWGLGGVAVDLGPVFREKRQLRITPFISRVLSRKKCSSRRFATAHPARTRQSSFYVGNNKIGDLCGDRLLQDNFINSFCEIESVTLSVALRLKRSDNTQGPSSVVQFN